MTQPHGLLGKAYVGTAFILASIILTAVGILIIIAPFWIIAIVFTVLVIAAIIGVVLLSMAPASGEG
jgi:hypothetical protein